MAPSGLDEPATQAYVAELVSSVVPHLSKQQSVLHYNSAQLPLHALNRTEAFVIRLDVK